MQLVAKADYTGHRTGIVRQADLLVEGKHGGVQGLGRHKLTMEATARVISAARARDMPLVIDGE